MLLVQPIKIRASKEWLGTSKSFHSSIIRRTNTESNQMSSVTKFPSTSQLLTTKFTSRNQHRDKIRIMTSIKILTFGKGHHQWFRKRRATGVQSPGMQTRTEAEVEAMLVEVQEVCQEEILLEHMGK